MFKNSSLQETNFIGMKLGPLLLNTVKYSLHFQDKYEQKHNQTCTVLKSLIHNI